MRAFVRTAALAVTVFAVLLSTVSLSASLTIIPTTTLTAETSNNTSAASTFTTSKNGNVASANVSKVNHHTLLYPGATTKIYTNTMYWFGPSNHTQVGYQSNDPAQVQKQVDDHLSRGIDGTIVDWYGPGHVVDDTATQYMMHYAETMAGLPFQTMVMVSAVGSTVGTAIVFLSRSATGMAVGVVLTGLSFAAIYPTVLALAGDRYQRFAGSVFGTLFAIALLGGVVAPAAVGAIGKTAGVHYGTLVPLAGAAMVAVLTVALLRGEAECDPSQMKAREVASAGK